MRKKSSELAKSRRRVRGKANKNKNTIGKLLSSEETDGKERKVKIEKEKTAKVTVAFSSLFQDANEDSVEATTGTGESVSRND